MFSQILFLEELQKRDAEFTEDLEKCQLFGNRFSLKGAIFEGFPASKTQQIWSSIANSLAKASNNELFQSMTALFSEVIETLNANKVDPEAIFQRSFKKWSIVCCGWQGHSVALIFSKTICVKIDTAQKEDAGISFFAIKNNDENCRKASIKKLIENSKNFISKIEGFVYFDSTLNEQLDLTLLALIPFSQKTPNCAWLARKITVLALFVLFDVERNGKVFSKDTISHSYHTLASAFNEWDDADRFDSWMEAMPLLKKYPKLFNMHEIGSGVIEDCMDEGIGFSLIVETIRLEPSLKNWRQPITGKCLIRLAVEKSHPILLVELIRLGCTLAPSEPASSLKIQLTSGDLEKLWSIATGLSPDQKRLLESLIVSEKNSCSIC